MSNIKRAIEDIMARGWPVNNESLQRLVQEREQLDDSMDNLIKESAEEQKVKETWESLLSLPIFSEVDDIIF